MPSPHTIPNHPEAFATGEVTPPRGTTSQQGLEGTPSSSLLNPKYCPVPLNCLAALARSFPVPQGSAVAGGVDSGSVPLTSQPVNQLQSTTGADGGKKGARKTASTAIPPETLQAVTDAARVSVASKELADVQLCGPPVEQIGVKFNPFGGTKNDKADLTSTTQAVVDTIRADLAAQSATVRSQGQSSAAAPAALPPPAATAAKPPKAPAEPMRMVTRSQAKKLREKEEAATKPEEAATTGGEMKQEVKEEAGSTLPPPAPKAKRGSGGTSRPSSRANSTRGNGVATTAAAPLIPVDELCVREDYATLLRKLTTESSLTSAQVASLSAQIDRLSSVSELATILGLTPTPSLETGEQTGQAKTKASALSTIRALNTTARWEEVVQGDAEAADRRGKKAAADGSEKNPPAAAAAAAGTNDDHRRHQQFIDTLRCSHVGLWIVALVQKEFPDDALAAEESDLLDVVAGALRRSTRYVTSSVEKNQGVDAAIRGTIECLRWIFTVLAVVPLVQQDVQSSLIDTATELLTMHTKPQLADIEDIQSHLTMPLSNPVHAYLQCYLARATVLKEDVIAFSELLDLFLGKISLSSPKVTAPVYPLSSYTKEGPKQSVGCVAAFVLHCVAAAPAPGMLPKRSAVDSGVATTVVSAEYVASTVNDRCRTAMTALVRQFFDYDTIKTMEAEHRDRAVTMVAAFFDDIMSCLARVEWAVTDELLRCGLALVVPAYLSSGSDEDGTTTNCGQAFDRVRAVVVEIIGKLAGHVLQLQEKVSGSVKSITTAAASVHGSDEITAAVASKRGGKNVAADAGELAEATYSTDAFEIDDELSRWASLTTSLHTIGATKKGRGSAGGKKRTRASTGDNEDDEAATAAVSTMTKEEEMFGRVRCCIFTALSRQSRHERGASLQFPAAVTDPWVSSRQYLLGSWSATSNKSGTSTSGSLFDSSKAATYDPTDGRCIPKGLTKALYATLQMQTMLLGSTRKESMFHPGSAEKLVYAIMLGCNGDLAGAGDASRRKAMQQLRLLLSKNAKLLTPAWNLVRKSLASDSVRVKEGSLLICETILALAEPPVSSASGVELKQEKTINHSATVRAVVGAAAQLTTHRSATVATKAIQLVGNALCNSRSLRSSQELSMLMLERLLRSFEGNEEAVTAAFASFWFRWTPPGASSGQAGGAGRKSGRSSGMVAKASEQFVDDAAIELMELGVACPGTDAAAGGAVDISAAADLDDWSMHVAEQLVVTCTKYLEPPYEVSPSLRLYHLLDAMLGKPNNGGKKNADTKSGKKEKERQLLAAHVTKHAPLVVKALLHALSQSKPMDRQPSVDPQASPAKAMSQAPPLADSGRIMALLSLIALVNPQLLQPHARVIVTYLKAPAPPVSEGVATVLFHSCRILKAIDATNLVAEIGSPAMAIIGSYSGFHTNRLLVAAVDVLCSLVGDVSQSGAVAGGPSAAVAAVAKGDGRPFNKATLLKVYEVTNQLYCRLRSIAAQLRSGDEAGQTASVLSQLLRALFLLGEFIRQVDWSAVQSQYLTEHNTGKFPNLLANGNGVHENSFALFSNISGLLAPELQAKTMPLALRGMASLCLYAPATYLKRCESHLTQAITGTNTQLHLQALQLIYDFLKDEEERVVNSITSGAQASAEAATALANLAKSAPTSPTKKEAKKSSGCRSSGKTKAGAGKAEASGADEEAELEASTGYRTTANLSVILEKENNSGMSTWVMQRFHKAVLDLCMSPAASVRSLAIRTVEVALNNRLLPPVTYVETLIAVATAVEGADQDAFESFSAKARECLCRIYSTNEDAVSSRSAAGVVRAFDFVATSIGSTLVNGMTSETPVVPAESIHSGLFRILSKKRRETFIIGLFRYLTSTDRLKEWLLVRRTERQVTTAIIDATGATVGEQPLYGPLCSAHFTLHLVQAICFLPFSSAVDVFFVLDQLRQAVDIHGDASIKDLEAIIEGRASAGPNPPAKAAVKKAAGGTRRSGEKRGRGSNNEGNDSAPTTTTPGDSQESHIASVFSSTTALLLLHEMKNFLCKEYALTGRKKDSTNALPSRSPASSAYRAFVAKCQAVATHLQAVENHWSKKEQTSGGRGSAGGRASRGGATARKDPVHEVAMFLKTELTAELDEDTLTDLLMGGGIRDSGRASGSKRGRASGGGKKKKQSAKKTKKKVVKRRGRRSRNDDDDDESSSDSSSEEVTSSEEEDDSSEEASSDNSSSSDEDSSESSEVESSSSSDSDTPPRKGQRGRRGGK